MSRNHPGILTVIRRAALRRCPVCGEGRIFASFLRLRRTCTACGWVIEREPGAVTGAMYLISIVSQLFAVALMVLMWAFTDWGPGVMVAVALPLIALFSLCALPVTKALWAAVDYLTDLGTGEAASDEYEARAFERERSG